MVFNKYQFSRYSIVIPAEWIYRIYFSLDSDYACKLKKIPNMSINVRRAVYDFSLTPCIFFVLRFLVRYTYIKAIIVDVNSTLFVQHVLETALLTYFSLVSRRFCQLLTFCLFLMYYVRSGNGVVKIRKKNIKKTIVSFVMQIFVCNFMKSFFFLFCLLKYVKWIKSSHYWFDFFIHWLEIKGHLH